MTTSALGVWTPGDSDDWDLTIDLAAMANSIDTVVLNQTNAINRRNVPSVANVAERTAFFPTPAQGNRVYRSDLGYEEAYFALYSGSNPGGATPAGWYPVNAGSPYVRVARTTFTTSNAVGVAIFASSGTTNYSPASDIVLGSTGTFTFSRIGDYEIKTRIQQSGVNLSGQRDISMGGTVTNLSPVNTNSYLAQSGVGAGVYLGYNTVRATASGQTVIPTVLQNSGGNLGFQADVTISYLGPSRT